MSLDRFICDSACEFDLIGHSPRATSPNRLPFEANQNTNQFNLPPTCQDANVAGGQAPDPRHLVVDQSSPRTILGDAARG